MGVGSAVAVGIADILVRRPATTVASIFGVGVGLAVGTAGATVGSDVGVGVGGGWVQANTIIARKVIAPVITHDGATALFFRFTLTTP